MNKREQWRERERERESQGNPCCECDLKMMISTTIIRYYLLPKSTALKVCKQKYEYVQVQE